MEIKLEEVEFCKYKVNYESSSDEFNDKKNEVLLAFKKASVPGFRKGKVPEQAIFSYYRKQIEESLRRALAEDAFHNTLFEKKIRAYSGPQFTNAFFNGDKFVCEFFVYTKPEFELSEFRGLEIPKPHMGNDFNTSFICEKTLQSLRLKCGEHRAFNENDFVQNGDNIVISYTANLDGINLDNLSSETEIITVGEFALENFDSNLLGMCVGENRKFHYTLPSNAIPSLAGKTVEFSVDLKSGSKIIPAPLDDSLAVKVGKKSFEDLRQTIMASAESQVAIKYKMKISESVCRHLLDMNRFNIPDWLKNSELSYIMSKLDWNNLSEQDKQKYSQISEQNVRLSLILDRIREVEPQAQLTDQEAIDMLKNNTNINNGKPFDEVIKDLNKSGELQVYFAKIRDENTIDYVCKNTKFFD